MGPTVEEQREKIRLENRKLSEENLARRMANRFYLCDYFGKGIYFLYKGGKIVYIGKSDGNVFRRICDHYEEKVKEFDSFTFRKYPVSSKELSKIEANLIREYKPKYNVVHNIRSRKPKIYYGLSRG